MIFTSSDTSTPPASSAWRSGEGGSFTRALELDSGFALAQLRLLRRERIGDVDSETDDGVDRQAIGAALIARGANVDVRPDGGGPAPLHEAAGQGHAAMVAQLIAAGADVNAPGTMQRTPLAQAADLSTKRLDDPN